MTCNDIQQTLNFLVFSGMQDENNSSEAVSTSKKEIQSAKKPRSKSTISKATKKDSIQLNLFD
ncbi:hypothetical protein SAMN04487911_105122 [Arenibacter nanhaiticus]|uniref:Uncharacterized protein n=1 Tax=Arenibacter nanhaiticus TaxID=558155 RepID=A0A1M6DSX8_9FLAO|nr:hypothetical protein [Arenibacter nanhaiticus]SHI76239.1 hypothetical protein SAMN04487911_105122 [Arenibacter nanhaiticus]